MQLSRRGFLGGLLAVVSAPAIVRVESLMVLPRPEIIIPQVETAVEYTLRTNSYLTMDQITREAIKLWTDSNKFIELDYDKEFSVRGAKIGSTLHIRLPNEALA